MPYDERFPLIACPVCDSTTFTALTTEPPHAVRCEGCGLGIERNVTDDPRSVYRPEEYDRTRNAGTGGRRWGRFHHDTAVAAARMRQMSDLFKDLPEDKVWLDIGSGNGAVPVVARRQGWQVRVVEADTNSCDEIHSVLGIPCLPYGRWVAEGFPGPDLNVVSLFDVLEHVLDFPAVIQAAAADLRYKGFLIVEVPDLDSCDVFTKWKHRRVSQEFTEHQYHFSEKSLAAAVARYAPSMESSHVARPVAGKLQMAWRKAVDVVGGDDRNEQYDQDDQMQQDARDSARDLMNMSEPAREMMWTHIQNMSPEFAELVRSHIEARCSHAHNGKK